MARAMAGRDAMRALTSPTVRLVTTPDLDAALERHAVASLRNLLLPYLAHPGPERVQTRTPATYDQVTHDRFPLRLVDASAPAPAPAADLFLDQVGQHIASNVNLWVHHDGDRPTPTPWYDALRDQVLARRDLAADLDSFDAPLATVVALSSANPDPLNALALLWDQAQLAAAAATPPDQPDRLRFVLLVHDHSDPDADWQDAQKLHDTVRKTYGLHTALVPLFFSTTAAAAPVHHDGPQLSDADVTALKSFAREFVVQSFVPFLERTAIVAHEQWTATRRGFGGRLFSVGRRYFGGGGAEGSRAASPGPAAAAAAAASGSGAGTMTREGYNATRGVYHPQSQLSQTRRLADLCLVLGDPKLAHAVYESLAKDYRADKAWRHAAAATRMAGLASLLVYTAATAAAAPNPSASTLGSSGPSTLSPLGSPNNNPDAYLVAAAALSSSSSSGGSSTAAAFDFDALRATVLYYELYRSLGAWALASAALVRTAGEADEVVCAVLLEQAALADSNAPVGFAGHSGKGRRRKYAFHLAMAAARYEKCGVKALSRRCLGQAAVLFEPSSPSASAQAYHPDYEAAEAAPGGTDPSAAASPPPLTALLDPRYPPPRDRDPRRSPSVAPWLSIRTYMHHSLARQAYTVGDALDAVEHFLQLLVGNPPYPSDRRVDANLDPAAVPATMGDGDVDGGGDWLDDFALAYSLLGDDADRLVRERGVRLPIRLFDAQNARLSSAASGSAAAAATTAATAVVPRGDTVLPEWARLERDMLRRAKWQNGTSTKRRPRTLSHRVPPVPGVAGSSSGSAAAAASWVVPPPFEVTVGETVMLELPIRNPLEAFLALGDVKVEIETTDPDGEAVVTSEAHATLDVELAPLEESKVYIPVQAAALGQLVFRSVSYRFSGLLPVSEPLTDRWTTPTPARPGQPSVRNRIPLAAAVRAPTPRVSVDLSALPSKLFHGGARTVTITYRNTGTTPIEELHFVCSHPEFVSTPGSATVGEGSDKSRQVSNSFETPAPVPLWPSSDRSQLRPGDSFQQEVTLRGDAPGQRVLQFLIAFRGDDDADSGEAYSTSAVHVLDTYPSLDMQCRIRPRFAVGADPFVLDVDVHNSGLPADDVIIEGIALISPTWRCAVDPTSWRRLGCLGWQQSTALSVPVTGATPNDEADVDFVKRVQTVLQGRDPPTAPFADIPLLQSSFGPPSPSADSLVASYAALRRTQVAEQFAMIPHDRHPSLFPLFFSRSAFLAIRFTSATLDLSGSSAATIVVPLDAPAIGSSAGSTGALALQKALTTAQGFAGGLYEESQRERTTLLAALGSLELLTFAAASPVLLDMQLGLNVQHDFASGPILLPVRFCLRNTSPSSAAAFSVQLGGVSSHTAAPFTGTLRHEGRLEPLTLEVVETQIWVSRPGTFVVGGGQVAVSVAGAADLTWQTRLPTRVLRVRAAPQSSTAAALSGNAQPLVDVRG
ncbi:hypothetical protein JCM3774_004598 [Rhodotorula dairenensis]